MKEFAAPLWENWREEIVRRDGGIDFLRHRYTEIPQDISILRGLRKLGEITEFEFENRYSALRKELESINKELWNR